MSHEYQTLSVILTSPFINILRGTFDSPIFHSFQLTLRIARESRRAHWLVAQRQIRIAWTSKSSREHLRKAVILCNLFCYRNEMRFNGNHRAPSFRLSIQKSQFNLFSFGSVVFNKLTIGHYNSYAFDLRSVYRRIIYRRVTSHYLIPQSLSDDASYSVFSAVKQLDGLYVITREKCGRQKLNILNSNWTPYGVSTLFGGQDRGFTRFERPPLLIARSRFPTSDFYGRSRAFASWRGISFSCFVLDSLSERRGSRRGSARCSRRPAESRWYSLVPLVLAHVRARICMCVDACWINKRILVRALAIPLSDRRTPSSCNATGTKRKTCFYETSHRQFDTHRRGKTKIFHGETLADAPAFNRYARAKTLTLSLPKDACRRLRFLKEEAEDADRCSHYLPASVQYARNLRMTTFNCPRHCYEENKQPLTNVVDSGIFDRHDLVTFLNRRFLSDSALSGLLFTNNTGRVRVR